MMGDATPDGIFTHALKGSGGSIGPPTLDQPAKHPRSNLDQGFMKSRYGQYRTTVPIRVGPS
jgi:hypothetical protein